MSESVVRYHVQHETVYRYSAPVTISRQLLHLSPRELPHQRCLSHGLSVLPSPSEWRERIDFFGNHVTQFALQSPHAELEVRSQACVELDVVDRPDADRDSVPWERLRERLRQVGPAPLLEPSQYLYASPHVELLPELARYAALDFTEGRPVLDAAVALMQRIHEDFDFDPKATTVTTSLEEVLSHRRGVCQDFAHLMIGCLRALGLPARYVSGYLLTRPPPGKPRLIGADASHAWVSVFSPQQGWVDMDPTNNTQPGVEHITVAWGRDFSDVTPMRGVILGGGEQELEVRVTVVPEGEVAIEPPSSDD